MEAGDLVPGPSNPLASTSLHQRSTFDLPEQAIQKACKVLEQIILPDNEDEDIQGKLDIVWFAVRKALSQHPELKGAIANEEEFKANVKGQGEVQFIELLRDMASRKSWRDLLDNRIYPPFVPFLSVMPSIQMCF
jgi:hypothetical protein